MAEPFRVDRSVRNGTTVLMVRGRLDSSSVPEMARSLEAALREPELVVIDLKGLTGLTGSGLAELVRQEIRSLATGRPARAENLPSQIEARLLGAGLVIRAGGNTGPVRELGGSFATTGWMSPMSTLSVGPLPPGVRTLNVNGRRPCGVFRGFGTLWQKTYRLRLPAGTATPEAAFAILRSDLPALQPPSNQFYVAGGSMAPGSVVLISAKVMGMPVRTGVVVMYADEQEFSLLTAQGHPESGWVTFSAGYDGGEPGRDVIVRIQSLARASDPMFEFALRFLGAGKVQEGIWRHVLTALAARFDVPAEVSVEKQVLSGKFLWPNVWNLRYNSGAWTLLGGLVGRA